MGLEEAEHPQLGAQVGELSPGTEHDSMTSRDAKGACTNGGRERLLGGKAVGEGHGESIDQWPERGPRVEPHQSR
jgi:hypothetical protein